MSRAEGRSLLAVAATNLLQVVAAWNSGERWKDLFGRWTWMERGLVRGDCVRLPGDIHGEISLTIDLLGRETPCKRHKLVLSLTVTALLSVYIHQLRIEHGLFGGLSSSCLAKNLMRKFFFNNTSSTGHITKECHADGSFQSRECQTTTGEKSEEEGLLWVDLRKIREPSWRSQDTVSTNRNFPKAGDGDQFPGVHPAPATGSEGKRALPFSSSTWISPRRCASRDEIVKPPVGEDQKRQPEKSDSRSTCYRDVGPTNHRWMPCCQNDQGKHGQCSTDPFLSFTHLPAPLLVAQSSCT